MDEIFLVITEICLSVKKFVFLFLLPSFLIGRSCRHETSTPAQNDSKHEEFVFTKSLRSLDAIFKIIDEWYIFQNFSFFQILIILLHNFFNYSVWVTEKADRRAARSHKIIKNKVKHWKKKKMFQIDKSWKWCF